MRSTAKDAQKAIRVVEMIAESGATPLGEIPTEHVKALLDTEDNSRQTETENAHRNGNKPPETADGGGGARD